MNLIKAFFVAVVFALAALLAMQNVEMLSKTMTFGLHWPASLAFARASPLYVMIMTIFLAGFVLVALFSLRENRARRLELRGLYGQIQTLERELRPAPQSAALIAQESQTHFQTETEQAMETSATPPIAEPSPTQAKTRDEVLVKASTPGWGAVILLATALALVVGGGVYIVLSERLQHVTAQLDELSGLTGHLSSTQEEMSRSWELERVVWREEIKAMGQSHVALLKEAGRLEDQVRALGGLPEEVRKRIVAGFLRETAGRVAYLGTQVDGADQRAALQGIHELLQTLALELEGEGLNSGSDSGGE